MVTSVADVLAGIAISGYLLQWALNSFYILPIILLSLSTACLYAGGVVFNDVFDADLDRSERPERPIPSGLIKEQNATLLGGMLIALGIFFAVIVNNTSAGLSLAITAAALVYDKWGKHQFYLGPVNMGLCRGLNLLLGMSIIPASLANFWFIALIPIVYIASITMISRGEVHGSNRNPLYLAALLYAVVIVAILFFAFKKGMLIIAAAFLLFLCWMIYKPLFSAIKEPSGKNIGKSVKAGVIALIVMDAAWAGASGSVYAALAIMVLLPLSYWLAKLFAVT